MSHHKTTTYLKETLAISLGQFIHDDSASRVRERSKDLIHQPKNMHPFGCMSSMGFVSSGHYLLHGGDRIRKRAERLFAITFNRTFIYAADRAGADAARRHATRFPQHQITKIEEFDLYEGRCLVSVDELVRDEVLKKEMMLDDTLADATRRFNDPSPQPREPILPRPHTSLLVQLPHRRNYGALAGQDVTTGECIYVTLVEVVLPGSNLQDRVGDADFHNEHGPSKLET